MSAIWLPSSAGMVDIRVWRLNEAAKEYDSRLMVGRNEANGYWTVYMAMGATRAPHPVLALTRDEENLPHPDDLKKKLYRMDTMRHGEKILERMNRKNDEIRKENSRAADEATELAAEALAWGHSRMTNRIENKRVSLKLNERADRRRLVTR